MSTQNQFGPGARRLLELCHIPLEKVGKESDSDATAEQAAEQQLAQPEATEVLPFERKRIPPIILAYILALAFMIVVPLSALHFAYDHFTGSSHKTERIEVSEVDEIDEEEYDEVAYESVATETPAPDNLSFTIYGQIGGFYDCTLILENGEGVVNGLNLGQRQVRVFEFDGNDYGGRLVLDAYLNGEYIGQYEGTYYNTAEGISYSGIFRNTKTGGKVDFDLNSERSERDSYEPDYEDYYDNDSYEDYGDAEPWIN